LEEESTAQETSVQDALRAYFVSADMQARIANNFQYHAPDEEQARRYTYLRAQLRALAYDIVERTPPGREQSVALTKLEEVGFWMNASIARGESHGVPLRPDNPQEVNTADGPALSPEGDAPGAAA
jgi:hypothetical protein